VSPPTRRGFGSAILLEAAEQFGSVTMKYLPEGLIYQLQLDLKAIEVRKNVTTIQTNHRAFIWVLPDRHVDGTISTPQRAAVGTFSSV
jgi:hypothetical protein